MATPGVHRKPAVYSIIASTYHDGDYLQWSELFDIPDGSCGNELSSNRYIELGNGVYPDAYRRVEVYIGGSAGAAGTHYLQYANMAGTVLFSTAADSNPMHIIHVQFGSTTFQIIWVQFPNC